MADLLTDLKKITLYTTKQSLTEYCWELFTIVLSSSEADGWGMRQRNQAILFCRFFMNTINAAFSMKEALIRDNLTNLNNSLGNELQVHLANLEEYRSEVDVDEMEQFFDGYSAILFKYEESLFDSLSLRISLSYFKDFFTRLRLIDLSF
ncbi:hypothetical protein HF324_13245 [Chitinophaga oryzae]|uniref:Uncharacterized protein n=1 Tax=Chitinophaga oryzae TaxID=2725414 RepID=A0ABX6LG83_9BACT|nr:hypothetical protein [Chitinophaga oryzae]QJB38778.1 hypothetical protein HF324_13245 [Chitinophaga oryzae]